MPSFPPSVELLPQGPEVKELPPPPGFNAPPKAARRRAWLFFTVLLICLAGSLAYVWLREPIYEAGASLLTVAPAPIDQGGAALGSQHVEVQRQKVISKSYQSQGAAGVVGGIEHVAIQRELLLGMPLLEATRRRLAGGPDAPGAEPPTVDDLHGMLSVQPVPDTNLVDLRARGPQRELLAPVVNAWIDAYQAQREQSVMESKDNTSTILQEEFDKLGQKVAAKRRALDQFRRSHDILTKDGGENQAMARLRGLNDALNKASEEEVNAAGKVEAIQQAIARGEPVVPPEEKKGLENLEKRAQDLREQVKDMKKRYLPQYVALQPQLKLIPEQLQQVEDSIEQMLEDGKREALGQAQQAQASAHRAVEQIQRQIQAHKKDAAEFTARFVEHEALATDLEQLEAVYRDTQSRLLQIEARPTEKYPQLQVVGRAYTPKDPVWPDYWRDSGIALAGSLATALLVLLIHDYLARREHAPAPTRLPDIQVFSVSENLLLQRRQDGTAALARPDFVVPALEQDRTPALENLPRELSKPELRMMLNDSDLRTRQVLGLLLSGLTLEEAAALGPAGVDLDGDRLLVVGGPNPRSVPLAPRLKSWLAEAEPRPAWADDSADPDDLAASIHCVASDAGVPQPETVDADAVRRGYMLYLIRQGMRLADLERVVGKLPAKTLAGFSRFSPAGPGLRFDSVPLIHPVLRAEPGRDSAAA